MGKPDVKLKTVKLPHTQENQSNQDLDSVSNHEAYIHIIIYTSWGKQKDSLYILYDKSEEKKSDGGNKPNI